MKKASGMKNKFWRAKNDNEAEFIASVLMPFNVNSEGSRYFGDSVWWSDYRVFWVGEARGLFASSSTVQIPNHTESTIEELVEWARNGFEEPEWVPEEGEACYCADPSLSCLYFVCKYRSRLDPVNHRLERGLLSPLTEEGRQQAIATAKRMLGAVKA